MPTHATPRNGRRFPLWISTASTRIHAGVDGNAATNRTMFTNIVLTGLAFLPDRNCFCAGSTPMTPVFDDGLALDDLSVSFGEPLTNAPTLPGTNATFSVVSYM